MTGQIFYLNFRNYKLVLSCLQAPFECCLTILKIRPLTCPEFHFKSEAKGDNLSGVQQTKTVKNSKGAYNFNSCVVLGIKWLWEYFCTGKEAKGLDNRYCVKFMQSWIGSIRNFKSGYLSLIVNLATAHFSCA